MDTERTYKKYEHLFGHWPSVKAIKLDGVEGLCIEASHYTPTKLKLADRVTFLWSIGWAVLILACIFQYKALHSLSPLIWGGAGYGLWAAFKYIGRRVARSFAKDFTSIVLSPDKIILGETYFDGRVQHKFTMDLHRKAKDEADAELQAQQRGPKRAVTRKPKYYRDAYHIYFEYLGQRILVADIFNALDAETFLRALNAVDRIMQNEKSVYAANSNVEEPKEASAQGRYKGHFGQRPALD